MTDVKSQFDLPFRGEGGAEEGECFGAESLARTILDARILIVDDQRSARDLIRMSLENSGYHNLQCANNGREALAQIRREAPDLIVLDLVMPSMDGYEFCRRLRQKPEFADTPVLVQSSVEGAEARGRVFDVGASDVVSKPIERVEFLSRVRTHLERHYLVKELRTYYRNMEQELDAIQDMQRCMLPDGELMTSLTDEDGLTIAASYQPSNRLGGDLWGALRLTDQSFAIFLADFSGRGAASALNTFRLKTFMDSGACDHEEPADVMAKINEYLVSTLNTGTFATMFYGVVDTQAGLLSWSASGCPPPILVHKNGLRTELATRGLPLGVLGRVEYDHTCVPFGQGDRLFMFSDGLVECPRPDIPVLSSRDVAELVGDPGLRNAAEIIASVVDDLNAKHQGPVPDDVTMLAVDWS
jgi:sigma-B regulation protein RsbU (phosphoserine phosphatase)